jgi:pimeloyl-ACP methyl ester carboxylesterase
VFIDFINSIYTARRDTGHDGIILVGHSLGGALALSVTYEAHGQLPILGVSAMGCLPSLKPLGILGATDPEPENPRFIVESNPENIRRFMGRPEWLNHDALSEDIVAEVFEPGKPVSSKGKNYTKYVRPQVRDWGISNTRAVSVPA